MPSTSSRPSARELLGGRWAISLRGWLILSFVLAFSTLGLKAQLGISLPTLAVFTLAFWLLGMVMYLAAHLTVFRNRRTKSVHIAWLIAFAIGMGLMRVALAFAVPEIRAALGDGWSGVFTAVLCLLPNVVLTILVVTYLIAVTDWNASERTRLMRFEIDAEAARLRAVGALNAARAVITTRIQTALEDQLSGLEHAAKVDARDDRLSNAILDTAADYVRPESHRLWQERDSGLRRGSLIAIERASLAAPLPIALPYALWAVIFVPASIARVGILLSLVAPLALIVAMAVLYPLGRAAIRRYAPAPRYMRARLIALGTMLAAGLATFAAAAELGSTETLLLQRVLLVFFVIVATIVVSWTQAALRTQDARRRSLRTHAEEAEIERLALEAATEQMQRELALYLHGTVQAGLVASAYSIQDAVNRGDTIALETAIANARFAVSQVGEHDQGVPATDLATLAQQHDAKWRGLVEITWVLPNEPTTAEAVHRIGNVVQESLANASIHGAASEATVRITVEDDCAIVEVTDNGTGPGNGKPGLGSAVLNEATGGQWSIGSVPTGGAQVRAVVPV